jgi:cytoplasmic iron level regulating protein YaaA (DUF328/UPF0246 family)
MTRIAFVSCVKTKSTTTELAEHLYISPWFRMAREYARRNADRWFILSAEHGLIKPNRIVDPYETTLNRMMIEDRKRWAEHVAWQMEDLNVKGDVAVVLAGERYREFLMNRLAIRFETVKIPMQGLQMGEQLSWMKNTLGG